MNFVKRLLREPLVLFLAAGALLYAAYAVLNQGANARSDRQEIKIDRKTLLEFMQFRAKAFEPGLFEKRFDEMSAAERKKLVDEYLEEEVLFREASSLGLEQGDYIIRQRMIQKLKFLLDDANEPSSEPSQAALDAFYAEHGTDYAEPPIYTFTHVFFDASLRPNPKADAEATLKEFNARGAQFNDAIQAGDRPLYFQNYVERTRDFVVDHFGEEMISALDKLPPSDKTWRGPYHSQYGWHIVLMTARAPGRIPPLSELRKRVADDYTVFTEGRNRKVSIARLMRQYRVTYADLALAPPEAGGK